MKIFRLCRHELNCDTIPPSILRLLCRMNNGISTLQTLESHPTGYIERTVFPRRDLPSVLEREWSLGD
jgi:hypothetical protein